MVISNLERNIIYDLIGSYKNIYIF